MRNRVRLVFSIVVFGGFMLSACATAAGGSDATESSLPATKVVVEQPTSTATDSHLKPTEIETEEPTSVPTDEDGTSTEAEPTDRPSETPISAPRGAESEFSTDFSVHSVPYEDILSGGPPKDGIPAIDEPNFVSVAEADEWLALVEPVIHVQVGDAARAYPIQVLTWHEIVNDTLNGLPLTVTFCPLCNTGIAFERTVDGEVLDFGTTGRLRFSNLIMYDRQTETWWQQASGEAIAGEQTGAQLEFYPAAVLSWEKFKSTYTDGDVLSRDTGYSRPYGQNPYTGYDHVNRNPFLYDGPETPDQLPAMARVLTVDLGEEAVAYPNDVLTEGHVVNDTVAGQEIVVFWVEGTASALDNNSIAAGRDVGSANAFSRTLEDQVLTFRFEDGRILDDQTDSEWDVTGLAIDGELSGSQLEPVVSVNHFWFSWAAFKPETRIYQP